MIPFRRPAAFYCLKKPNGPSWAVCFWRYPLEIKDALAKFRQQKYGARRRGIEWKLTFKQWLEWWGDDLDRRGVGTSNLQMQRPADRGPYELGNIRKGTPRDNRKTAGAMQRLKATMEAKAALEAARDASEPVSEDWLDEDEYELQKMFGVRSSCDSPVRFVRDKQSRRRY